MEPVFLAAEEDAIPGLRRFVVSDGQRVAMEETLAGAVAALAGAPRPSRGEVASATEPASRPGTGALPAEALDLLDRAEERLRQGDWTAFGEALEELRRLLRGAGGAGPPAGGGGP
jgi:hypothetical protein